MPCGAGILAVETELVAMIAAGTVYLLTSNQVCIGPRVYSSVCSGAAAVVRASLGRAVCVRCPLDVDLLFIKDLPS